jgi:hypothetical protein
MKEEGGRQKPKLKTEVGTGVLTSEFVWRQALLAFLRLSPRAKRRRRCR